MSRSAASASVASLAAARDASSDPSSPASIAALEDISSSARDANRRASLAAAGAAALVADHLADASRGDPAGASAAGFLAAAKALRNLCAGDVDAKRDAARRGAHDALAAALVHLTRAAEHADSNSNSNSNDSVVVSALAAGTQLACNLCAGGGDAERLAWRALFPRVASRVASLRGAAAHAAHPPLVALVHARHAAFGATGEGAAADAFDPTRPFGFEAAATVWRPLLEAAADDHAPPGAGGGEWLPRVVAAACLFAAEALPPLCRGLAPRAAETAAARDEALRAKLLKLAVEDAPIHEVMDGGDGGEGGGGGGAAATEESTFSVAQATLLALVTDAVEAAPETDPAAARRSGSSSSGSSGSSGSGSSGSVGSADVDPGAPPPTLVLSEGTLAYVLDLASRAAATTHRAATGASSRADADADANANANAARATLRASLHLLRALTERETRPSVAQTPGDVVTAATAMGLPRLLLSLTAAMPPPLGAGQTSKAGGPTAAPRLDPASTAPPELREGHPPYPSARPWEGYRVDLMAPLANAMYGRPLVAEAVAKLGGVGVILAATRGEDGDDYLREWALWATRNICAGSDDARREIEALQPQTATAANELAAAGLDVRVDPETGRVKVGSNARGRAAAAALGVDGVENASGAAPVVLGGPARGGGGGEGSGATPSVLVSGGGRARTPAGRAIQAAIEAGLAPRTGGEGEEEEEEEEEPFVPPKHWKVADLS